MKQTLQTHRDQQAQCFVRIHSGYKQYHKSGFVSKLVGTIYADARKNDGNQCKLSALKSMRFGLARHFMNELKVDIIKDVRFKKANDMFQAMSVDLKRKELDNIEYTEVFEEDPVLNSLVIHIGARGTELPPL